MYRLAVIVAIVPIILVQITIPSFAEYECPETYKTQNHTHNLATHDTRTEGSFKIIKCKYGSLQASGTEFEVNWSSTGTVQDKKWCKEQFEIEYGHALFSSDNKYVTITAQGIQIGTERAAQEFINELYNMVKKDASSCSVEPKPDMQKPQMEEKPKEETTSIPQQNAVLRNTSSQANETHQAKNTQVKEEVKLYDDPYLIILGAVAAGVAGIVVITRKRKNKT